MLKLADEVNEQRELTRDSRETLSLVSTPGNPFMPSSRLVSDSDQVGSVWVEAGERTAKRTLVLEIVNQQLSSAQHALEKAPDSPFLLNSLGLNYLNAGKVDEAIRYFEKALSIKSDLTSARLNLAKAQLVRGNLEGALSIYTDLLRQYPRRSVIHESLGEIYLRLALARGDKTYLEKAEQQLKESAETNPSALNNLGIVYILKGNSRAAIGCFKKALTLEPRAAKPNFNIAICYVKERNYEKAIRHFASSLSLDRQNIEAAKWLARVYLLGKQYTQAVELLSEYEGLNSGDAQLLEILGEALFYSKNYRACLKCLLRVQDICESTKARSRDLARNHNNLGCVYSALGDRERAEEFFRKGVKESLGVVADAHYNLVALYLKDNRYDEALPLIQVLEKDVSEVSKRPGRQVRFNNLLARYYFYLGDYETASRYLIKVKTIEPGNTSSCSGISYILSEVKGDYGGAITALKEGLSYAPTNPMLLNNLAYNYLMKGDIEKAREVLDRINEQDAVESVHINATRGLLLIKEGAIEEGARFYNRAINIAKDEEVRTQVRQKKNLELGRYFLDQGKAVRAKKLLEEVLSTRGQTELYKKQAADLLRNIE